MSRLGGPTHGIVTKSVHKTLPGSLFYLSETGPCGDISSSDLFPIYRRSSLLSLLHVFTYFVGVDVVNSRHFNIYFKTIARLFLSAAVLASSFTLQTKQNSVR